MIDIQKRGLGSLEQNGLACFPGPVDEKRRIGNVRESHLCETRRVGASIGLDLDRVPCFREP